MDIYQIPLLQDNYSYILREGGKTAVVDPSNFETVDEFLTHKAWGLDFILNTHHHWDHRGGNAELKAKYQSQIVAPIYERPKMAKADQWISKEEIFSFGQTQARILFLPGHTKGHIAYFFSEERALFCGDVLFALGCGRIFEGTKEEMWESLNQIVRLPLKTKIYCGHEYTFQNALFALKMEPDNQNLVQRFNEIKKLREQKCPTVPSFLHQEKKTNPFLRTQNLSIQRQLNMEKASPFEVFVKMRALKDIL